MPLPISLYYIKHQSQRKKIKSIQTNTTHYHNWHSALLHVSILKLIQNIRIHQFYMFFVNLQWLTCLNVLREMPDGDSSEIETYSSVQCHLLNCVWLKFWLFYVKNVTERDDSYNVIWKIDYQVKTENILWIHCAPSCATLS